MSRPASAAEPRIVSGLSELIDRYDAAIVDLWGVLHDGVAAFPAALDALSRLKAAGKGVAILSNAPRRAAAVILRNAELGIGPGHFDVLLSSGEDCWRHLEARPDDFYRGLGRRCHHIGPERDWGLRDGLDYDFAAGVEAADFVLCSGADTADDRPEDFDPVLTPARERGLPMVCANPDIVVIRGGVREICAGAIAGRYEDLGGAVRYHGKPHPGVFLACLDMLGGVPAGRALMIGDSLTTDIAGANAAGIDSLLVTGGIHAEALGAVSGGTPAPERLAELYARIGETPTAAVPELHW